MNKFLKYLNSSTKSKKNNILNEAKTVSLAKQFWPKFTVNDLLRLMKYSSDYDTFSGAGTFKVKADAKRIVALDSALANMSIKNRTLQLQYDKKLAESITSGTRDTNSTLNIKINPKLTDVDVVKALIDKISNDNSEIKKLSWNIEEKKVPNKTKEQLLKKVKSEKDQNKIDELNALIEKLPDTIVNSIAIKTKGPKDTILSIDDVFKSENINGVLSIPTHPDLSDNIDIIINGLYQYIEVAYLFLLGHLNSIESIAGSLYDIPNYSIASIISNNPNIKVQKTDIDSILKVIDDNFEFSQDITDETKWIYTLAYKSIYSNKDDKDKLLKAIEFEKTHNTVDSEKNIAALNIKLANLDTQYDSVDSFCLHVKDMKLISKIHKFHLLRRQELDTLANTIEQKKAEDIKNGTFPLKKNFSTDQEYKSAQKEYFDTVISPLTDKIKSEWTIGKELIQIPTLKSLEKEINYVEETAAEKKTKNIKIDTVEKVDFNASSNGGKCAQRRMKLFAAALHEGAEIIKTADWIAAICKTGQLTVPFGRLKPKVIPGTNDIDPECNLEDWEGITPENKAKRDDQTGKYPCIKDNIDDGHGHSFNSLTGENSAKKGVQYAETDWCVTGAVNGNFNWGAKASSMFNNYTNSGKLPMVVFMSVKRGALYLYAKYEKNGEVIENFLNENEKCDGDSPNTSDPSDTRQMKFLKDFETVNLSFKTFKKYICKKYYSDFEEDDIEIDLVEPDFGQIDDNGISTTNGGKCAQRRMKLFAAALHEGAEIIKTADWIAAICESGYQAHPFGRLKPIVDKNNLIIDKYNKEDWEGISSDDAAIRDDVSNGSRIKDNIDDGYGHSLNNIRTTLAGQAPTKYAEGAWCVCGTVNGNFSWKRHNDSYFNQYAGAKGSGKYPLTFYMSTKSGRMYLYAQYPNGTVQFSNEEDRVPGTGYDGPNAGSNYQLKFLKNHCEINTTFNKLHKNIVSKYYKNSKIAKIKSPEQLYEEAESFGKITSNGFLKINNKDDVKKYKPIFGDVNGLLITTAYALNLFSYENLLIIDKIDFNNTVQDATGMFENAVIGNISLLNTASLQIADRMFSGATLDQLDKFDTSGITMMNNIFYNVSPSKGGKLKLPPFDLTNCVLMNYAFTGTNIQRVTLLNVEKVQSAKSMFVKCQYLDTYPETKFPSMMSIVNLTDGDSTDALDIFEGCLTLQSKSRRKLFNNNPSLDFDSCLADTIKYYESNKDKLIVKDDRGFIIIDSAERLNCYYNNKVLNVPQDVVIKMKDASGLFRNRTISFKTLDLSEVNYADNMFDSTRIKRLDAVIGTENILHADHMFSKITISILPHMVFNKLQSFNGFLYACNNLKELPDIEINVNKNSLLNLITFNYVFGDKNYVLTTIKYVGEERLKKWVDDIKTNGLKNIAYNVDEDGFITSDDIDEIRSLAAMPELFKQTVKDENGNEVLKYKGITIDIEDAYNVFKSCNIKELPVLNLKKVKNATSMFYYAKIEKMNGFVNTENITDASLMFSNFSTPDTIPEIITSNIINAKAMFSFCSVGKPIAWKLDFSNAINCSYLFYNSSNILTNGIKINDIKLNKAEYLDYAFYHVKDAQLDLTDKLVFEKCINALHMFSNTKIKPNVKHISFPVATDVSSMFGGCSTLETVGTIDIPASKTCNSLFSFCNNLKYVYNIIATNSIRFNHMFADCINLKTIVNPTNINTQTVYDNKYMFKNTPLSKLYGVHGDKFITLLNAIKKIY